MQSLTQPIPNTVYTLRDLQEFGWLGTDHRIIAKVLRDNPDYFGKPRGTGKGTRWYIVGKSIINYLKHNERTRTESA